MVSLHTFTKSQDTFISLLTNSNMDCAITADHELLIWDTTSDKPWDCAHETKPKMIKEFPISLGFSVVTLKAFMAEHYPDVDVDVEFETHRPGVFGRFRAFNESAYFDFQEYQKTLVFESLMVELEGLGYRLTFEDQQGRVA